MVLATVLFPLEYAYAGAAPMVIATGEWLPYTSKEQPG